MARATMKSWLPGPSSAHHHWHPDAASLERARRWAKEVMAKQR